MGNFFRVFELMINNFRCFLRKKITRVLCGMCTANFFRRFSFLILRVVEFFCHLVLKNVKLIFGLANLFSEIVWVKRSTR